VVRATRETEVPGIGPDHDKVVAEPLGQPPCPFPVGLDGDDTQAAVQERSGEGTLARPHIKDSGACGELRVSYEPFGPLSVELVPAPALLWRAHGGGPS
jgi:hypothetical protein